MLSGGTGASPVCSAGTTAVLAPTYVPTDVGGKPTVVFSTVNVQIVSGSGSTGGAVNGEGNLIVGYAEKKKVTLCLEMLNSRVDAEMKGHPGYQGDHTDYCVELIKRVGSDRMKLLFDVYHVQIMDGDVIRRIRQHKDYIAHVHTAGNPGRRQRVSVAG